MGCYMSLLRELSLPARVSILNSSNAPLIAGATFVGAWEAILDAGSVNVNVKTTQLGSCYFECSSDGINIDRTFLHLLSDATNYALFFSISPRTKYIRIRFTNTSVTNQSTFRLQTIHSPTERGSVYIPVGESLTDNSTAKIMKSIISAKREDGTYNNVRMSNDNSLYVTNQPYSWSIAEGYIPGHIGGTAKGERTAISVVTTGNDVWQGVATTLPIPPDSGNYISVVSTSTQDTLTTGTGIWSVCLAYIDAATGVESIVNLDMNGTTPVNTGILMRYVNRVSSVAADGALGAVGTITVYKTGTPTTVYRQLIPGANTDLGCDFMVPGNYQMFLTEWKCSVAGAGKPVAMRLRATMNERSGTITPRLFHAFDTEYIEIGRGGGKFDFPVKIPPYCIVKVTSFASQAGPYVSAGFAGWMELMDI